MNIDRKTPIGKAVDTTVGRPARPDDGADHQQDEVVKRLWLI